MSCPIEAAEFRPVADSPVFLNAVKWDLSGNGTGRTKSVREMATGEGLLRDLKMAIVDDCTLNRVNLAATIVANGAPTPSVAWDMPSLLTALEDPTLDIVLVSIGTREDLALLKAALRINPAIRAIMFGVSSDDEAKIVACAEAGAVGYHMRTESLDDLLALIGKVAAGESVCSPAVTSILLKRLSSLASARQVLRTKELALTARESQVLRMLEIGLSNREIAARLCIAVHTVKNHVHSLLHKLGVSTRAEAAALSRTDRCEEIRYGT